MDSRRLPELCVEGGLPLVKGSDLVFQNGSANSNPLYYSAIISVLLNDRWEAEVYGFFLGEELQLISLEYSVAPLRLFDAYSEFDPTPANIAALFLHIWRGLLRNSRALVILRDPFKEVCYENEERLAFLPSPLSLFYRTAELYKIAYHIFCSSRPPEDTSRTYTIFSKFWLHRILLCKTVPIEIPCTSKQVEEFVSLHAKERKGCVLIEIMAARIWQRLKRMVLRFFMRKKKI